MKKLFFVCMASFLLFALSSCKPPVPSSPTEKVTITVTQATGGTISLSGSGVPADISAAFEIAKGSELSVTLKAKNPEQKAASLKIGDTEYTTANDDGDDPCIIVKKCKVETVLEISGTISDKGKFTVTVIQPTDGKISVTENANELSGNKLENILEGTKLSVTLEAKEGYEVNFLKINGETFEDKQDGKIVHTFTLAENVSVSGGVSKPINQAAPTLKTLTIDGKSISFNSSSIDCGETMKESVSVECTTSNDANVIFDPALNSEKWNLNPNTVNTLKITLKDKMAPTLVNEYTVSLTQYQEHKVSVSQPANGTIAVFEKGKQLAETELEKVRHGTALTFIVQPAPGWEVKGWNGAEKNSSDPNQATATITEDITVTCTLQKKQCTISFVTPANATLSAEKNEKPFTIGENAEYGDIIKFTVKPENGFWIREWNAVFDDGTKAPFESGGSEEEEYIRLKITGNTTVSVTLEKTIKPEVVMSPEYTASCKIGVGESPYEWDYHSPFLKIFKGDTCCITVSPRPGYELDSVKVGGTEYTKQNSQGEIVIKEYTVGSALTITITASKTLEKMLNDVKVTPRVVDENTDKISLIGEGITWKAKPEGIINTDTDLGKVTHPESPTVVTLTATAEKNGATKEKTFSVTVAGTSGVNDDQAILDALVLPSNFDGGIYDLDILPNTAGNGITWKSSDPRCAIYTDHRTGEEKLKVVPDFREYTLLFTATLGSATKDFPVTINKVEKIDHGDSLCEITENTIKVTYYEGGKIVGGSKYSYALGNESDITIQQTHAYIPDKNEWYDYDKAKKLMTDFFSKPFNDLKGLEGKANVTLSELKEAVVPLVQQQGPSLSLGSQGIEVTDEEFYEDLHQEGAFEVSYTDFMAKTDSEQTEILKKAIDFMRTYLAKMYNLPAEASWDEIIPKASSDWVEEKLESFIAKPIDGTYEFFISPTGTIGLWTNSKYNSEKPWYEQAGSYSYTASSMGPVDFIELSTHRVNISINGKYKTYKGTWNSAFTHCNYHDPSDPSKNFEIDISNDKNGTIKAKFSGSVDGTYALTFSPRPLLY